MKQYLKTSMAATLVSLSLTFSAAADMQSRLDMIEALEVTQDYDRLDKLVADDDSLLEYYQVLRRAAAHHEDANLVRTLLTLPAIDKNSDRFKRVVSGVYGYLGQFEDQNPEILKLLLQSFSDDQQYLDNTLSFIFDIVANYNYPIVPDAGAAKLLIEKGADIDKAYPFYEGGLRARIQKAEDDLKEFQNFRDKVMSPN